MWQIIVGAVGFLVFLVPVFEGVLNFGNLAGMSFFGAVILWGIFRKKIRAFLPEIRKKKPVKILTNIICIGFCCVMAWVIVGGGLVIHGIVNDPPAGTEVVVVLGCKVNDYGPSRTLRKRLDAAKTFLDENPDAVCIVTGGQGDDEPCAEGDAMHDYLVAAGIDESRIYVEDKSTSTKENLEFAKEIIEKELGGNITEIAIATSDYHEYRASIVAKECGFKAYSVPAASPREMFATYFVREVFGIIGEVFFR